MDAPYPVAAVGTVCLRPGEAGPEVLLIRRGRPPRVGEWSLPGGRIEWGETTEAAALRELREETGVSAKLVGLIDVVDGLFPSEGGELQRHYVLIDYAAHWRGGEPVAGDDAIAAQFMPLQAALDAVEWFPTKRVIKEAVQRFWV